MKLSKAEIKIIDEVAKWHRAGTPAEIYTGTEWLDGTWKRPFHDPSVSKLIDRGFLKELNGPDPHRKLHNNKWYLEITPAGWDYIYRINADRGLWTYPLSSIGEER